jgi:putative hydrolase of the HAD superfamily
MKHAIILDLDNTIFPVPSIGDELFAPLFELLEKKYHQPEQLIHIRKDIMRRPFQWVADHYSISDDLTRESIELLKSIRHEGRISAFPDFDIILNLPSDKFLVTTGFKKMQQSKIDALNLKSKFKDIIIIDPTSTKKVKKDIFQEIVEKHGYDPVDVVVIGDDPDSEIKAARELKIDSVLYDPAGKYPADAATFVIRNYKDLLAEEIFS